MSRFLSFGSARKVAHSFIASRKCRCPGVIENKEHYSVGFPYSLCRLYSQYKFYSRRDFSFTLYRVTDNLWKSSRPRKLHSLSASNKISHHAILTWKSLYHICSYSGPVLTPLSRIACAVSLALTRSNLVAPGVVALIIGELFWTQRTWAEAEHLPTRDTLYMHAQNGHVYLTSFVFLLLECIILFFRAIYLAILFSPCIVMAPFADSLGFQFRQTWLHVVHRTLEKAGPAFIKWGQWAATRPDLFARDLCTELTKLHTQAPAHSFSFTKKTIEKAFGRRLPEIFENFEEEPVASGSIAQVHKATLKYRYPGQKIKPIVVAVKVRHPGAGEAIRRDFVLLNLVAKVSNVIPTLKWLRLDESLKQFAVFMISQVDLAREAAHLSRFIYNFRRWKDVSFPKPLYPLVHPAVLVETFEQGQSVLRFIEDHEGQHRIKRALAHIGTHAFLKMLLVDNFIHADMHPGNILVRVTQSKAPSKRSRPHVVFLDVGMTAELSKSDRVNLLEFFKAVALQDGRTAAECTLRLSKQQNCSDPEVFIKEVEESFKFWGTREGDFIQPAECIQQLLEKVRCHRVNIDGNVCTVMVTALVLESWQHKLDPEYDVIQTLQTLLFKSDWAESLNYTIEGLMAP